VLRLGVLPRLLLHAVLLHLICELYLRTKTNCCTLHQLFTHQVPTLGYLLSRGYEYSVRLEVTYALPDHLAVCKGFHMTQNLKRSEKQMNIFRMFRTVWSQTC